jgi:transcriptional regulator with XRE-family HTH domain
MTSEQLKAFRLAHNLTQRQLARALWVSTQTLINWETGRHHMPPASAALALYRFATADLDTFIRLTDKENP